MEHDSSTSELTGTKDGVRTLLNWGLALAAAIGILIVLAELASLSASPDDLAPGIQFIVLAVIIGFFAVPLWLVVGIAYLIRGLRRLLR